MAVWLDSIPATEVYPSRVESFSNFGGGLPEPKVTLKVRKEDKNDALKNLLGTPKYYPELICDMIFYATKVTIRPDGAEYESEDGEQAIPVNYVLFDVVYQARLGRYYPNSSDENYPNSPNYYVEDGLEPRTEFYAINNKLLAWDDSDKTPVDKDEAPIRYESGVTLHHTIAGHSQFQLAWIDLIGTVATNAYASQNLGIQFSGEKLLLRSMTAALEYNHTSYNTGFPAWNLQLRYEYKKRGWNDFWRPDYLTGGKYNKMLLRNNPTVPITIFDLQDHSDLLF